MSPEIVIPALVAIAIGFLILPAIIIAATGTRRSATCPHGGMLIQIQLGRREEVKRQFTDSARAIGDCSRWPEKAGCDQACIGSIS